MDHVDHVDYVDHVDVVDPTAGGGVCSARISCEVSWDGQAPFYCNWFLVDWVDRENLFLNTV